MALVTPLASMPGCLKKFLSSAERKELITFFGIASKGTNSLFWVVQYIDQLKYIYSYTNFLK